MCLMCYAASINAGKIIAFWNLPLFSYSSPHPSLIDKKTYNTLLRLLSPFNMLAEATVDVFQHFQVSNIGSG